MRVSGVNVSGVNVSGVNVSGVSAVCHSGIPSKDPGHPDTTRQLICWQRGGTDLDSRQMGVGCVTLCGGDEILGNNRFGQIFEYILWKLFHI